MHWCVLQLFKFEKTKSLYNLFDIMKQVGYNEFSGEYLQNSVQDLQ